MNSNTPQVKMPSIPVVKKGAKISLLKNNSQSNLLKCIRLTSMVKDEVIYKSVRGDFLRGEYPNLVLVSRLNLSSTQTRTTIAKFDVYEGGKTRIIEKSSDEIVKLIGQNKYDTVFSALCSVISQELRIRAILALLTTSKTTREPTKTYSDTASQTDETSNNLLTKSSQRRKLKKSQFKPYIVKVSDETQVKKIVINPKDVLKPPKLDKNKTCDGQASSNSNSLLEANRSILKNSNKLDETKSGSFPDLSRIVDEDSNISDISTGNISMTSQFTEKIPSWVENQNLLWNKDIFQPLTAPNTVPLTLWDGSVIMVCAKPMDKFHWASGGILNNLSPEDRGKLICQQALFDWKYCLEKDEDGYLPIHQAVMNNDLEFLKRQCGALKKKYGSVDVPSHDNISPLRMSLYPDGEACMALLLASGADLLAQDDEGATVLHAAAQSANHLATALRHCRLHAREILKDDDQLWKPEMENQPDEELAKLLLDHACIMCDNSGYTPLMHASKQGCHEAVRLLVDASPDTINRPMPNCGNTALYLAVSAACIESANSTNHTKISEGFMKTIEILVETGADPSLENHSGGSVNVLLTEFNIVELSLLIANKLTSIKYFNGNSFAVENINSLMLYKNSNGSVNVTEIRAKNDNRIGNDVDKIGEKTDDVDRIVGESDVEKEGDDEMVIDEAITNFDEEISADYLVIDPNEVTVVTDLVDIANTKSMNANRFMKVTNTARNAESKVKIEAPKYVRILPKLIKVPNKLSNTGTGVDTGRNTVKRSNGENISTWGKRQRK